MVRARVLLQWWRQKEEVSYECGRLSGKLGEHIRTYVCEKTCTHEDMPGIGAVGGVSVSDCKEN